MKSLNTVSLNILTSIIGVEVWVVDKCIVDSMEIEAEIELLVNICGQTAGHKGIKFGYSDLLRCVSSSVERIHYLSGGK